MSDATMLAAVYHGPDDLRLEQVPLPAIGPGEALLRVTSACICGTDLRILHGGHRKYPAGTVRIPGHEVVGEIARVGSEVVGLTVGQRVFVAPNMGCGHCRQCVSGNNNLCADYQAVGITLDGGFAEYMRIPAAAIAQGNLMPIARRGRSRRRRADRAVRLRAARARRCRLAPATWSSWSASGRSARCTSCWPGCAARAGSSPAT